MDQLSAHLDRAWDLVHRGDYAGAMHSAEKSLEMDPDSAEVHHLMGYIRAHEGRADEAIEHYERAIELDESFVEAMLNAAEVRIHPMRDWDGAIKLIDDALDWIEDAEEEADATLVKIDALIGKGDLEGARRALDALPEGPFQNPALGFLIGRARFEIGDVDAATPWLRRAVEQDGGNAEAQYFYGLVLQQKGDLRGASVAFLQARDAELRLANGKGPMLPADQFERRIQAAIRRVPPSYAHVIDGALVIASELPGAEVVAEGVDPRLPVLLDDLSSPDEAPRVGRVFIYQRNVERGVSSPLQMEEEIARALAEEIAHTFPELAADAAAVAEDDGASGSTGGSQAN